MGEFQHIGPNRCTIHTEMARVHPYWIVPALGAALVAAACSGHQEAVRTTPQPVAAGHGDSLAIARARADSASHPYTEADIRFMTDMIGHHAQALVMAGWAPTHGASPSVRILCERIINAQQDEIATMQRWLGNRNQPVPQPEAMLSHMAMHGMLMPGMLTDAQMKELDAARGPEFDRLFLTYMIQHHRGAVAMVQNLFGSYGAAQDETVFKFASDVNVDQTTEIARMEKMLAALPLAQHSS
jgi:uncharacterized protein (DUF305 family)